MIYQKLVSIALLSYATFQWPLHVSAADRFEEKPIDYLVAPADNPVSRLQAAINANEKTLTFDEQFGYLKSLLVALDISTDSQLLVFSKTSFQNQRITPETPRAIYFNDESYIGTVQRGDVIEVSTTDPKLGTVFYTLSQSRRSKPEFVRQDNNCLQCHASTLTRGTPGHVVRSVYPDDQGYPILTAGTQVTTQNTPLEKRWGGWYVTGTHGDARHLGNEIAREVERDAELDIEGGANRLLVDKRVDSSKYLTPHSDIVSHIVLGHQAQTHNLITRANFETRIALWDQAIMDEILERDPESRSESTKRRIANIGKLLADYMLFADEVGFSAPIKGSSTFTETFSALGPHDSKGRSLRDFDLNTRMFRYPMSFLIYTESFDTLPPDMLDFVYRRLWDILSGNDDNEKYRYLDKATRTAIVEILLETKPGLPDYWQTLDPNS